MKWIPKMIPAAMVATLILLGTAREGQGQWMNTFGYDSGFSTFDQGISLGGDLDFQPHYSYFASFPDPARLYVPYGTQDTFYFHGQPYGHPYDRWSWTYLSGTYGAPARYFYPPLR
ncbi:hypothetical protein BH23PLA1_BH23PLA1_06600 [soil metagenome]